MVENNSLHNPSGMNNNQSGDKSILGKITDLSFHPKWGSYVSPVLFFLLNPLMWVVYLYTYADYQESVKQHYFISLPVNQHQTQVMLNLADYPIPFTSYQDLNFKAWEYLDPETLKVGGLEEKMGEYAPIIIVSPAIEYVGTLKPDGSVLLEKAAFYESVRAAANLGAAPSIADSVRDHQVPLNPERVRKGIQQALRDYVKNNPGIFDKRLYKKPGSSFF